MKQPKRILAYSALALIVMLAAFGAIAFDTSNVAHAQTVPMAPTLTAQASGASTINLSWGSVPDAASYELWAWDNVNEWQRLDGGATSPLTATTFAHTGLTSGTTYYYQVRAVNASGGVSAWSDRVNEVAGTTAPARPVLTATAGYQQITVSWPAVPGTARYELWAWDNSWTRLDGGVDSPLTDTSYTHTGLTAGRTYYYQARATNSDGVMSAWSDQVSAVVLSSPNISAPTSFMAARGDQMVTLTWGAPASIAGLTLAGYEYRYAASGATLPATWMSAGNVLMTNVSGLNNGTTYNFELRAVSTTDAKGDVAMASATPSTMPDAPMLTATEGYRLVMLSWDAPANNGAAITDYHIEMLNTQNNWVPETSLPGTATSYTDSGLRDSAVYTYRIIAENVAGRSSASNSADATTLAQPAQVPGMPSSIAADEGAGMVKLTWGAPLFNGGSPITEYQYRYKVATANSYGSWMSAMTALTVDVKPLMPGNMYEFEVRARNSVGAGDAINTENLGDTEKTPTATAPTAVPRLRTTLGAHAGATAVVARHQSTATITVSWDALGPTVNGSAEIDGYELCYKKSTDSAWMTWDGADPGFSAPAAVGGGGALWSAVHGADEADGLLDPGTTYQYRARALNSVSSATAANDACTHWDGAWSNVVSATTPVVAPAPPTLAASDDTTNGWVLDVNSITIKWTAPTETGGADITSYEVWVDTTSVDDSNAEAVAALSPTVTNLPPSRTEFISIGLSSETPYYYRVRARNGSGDSRVGDWSDEESGTTTVTQAGTPGQAGTPTLTGSVADDGSVTIEWTAPDNQGSSPITKYEVQYQRDDDDDDDDWGDASLGTPNPPAALTWTHMQAPGGSTIEYRVRAVNGSGAGEWSDELRQAVGARIADAPMLTATAVGDDEILLQWTIPEDNGTEITGFNIQQWDPDTSAWGTENLLAADSMETDAELTVFSVTDLSAGTKFYFHIQATGTTAGTWSATDMADAASATTEAGLPDAPVITVTAGSGDDDADSITVAWTAPNSGGSDILGYELRKWDGSKWMLEASPAAGAIMHKDEGLAPGTRHYYVLAARNSMGRGPWSDEMSDMTAAGNPDAPMLTAVATGADSIQLSWTVPDANGATFTGYQLVRWDNEDPGEWGGDNLLTGNPLADADAETVTEFEDTGLDAGTKYYYRIRALPQPDADSGWSATGMSDATSATTHGDTPERPTWATGAFAPTANSLMLVWEAPTMTGGSAITGYELRIWNGSQWAPEATLGNDTTYTDMNLDAGTKYYYIVRAINSQGAGLWSAFKAGTTDAENPDAPVLTAMPQGMKAVRLTWMVPDDNGTPINGYELQRWETSTDPDAWGTTNLLGDTDNNITLFVDEMRMPGMTYYYRVRATTGNGSSSWSGIKSATTVAGAPGRPMMVMAAADGQNAIDLTWQAAMANGSAVVRYELQRWDAANSMWMPIRNDLPSTRTSYKDTMLTADTRYVYRLRAVNRAADNNGMGKWSTLATGTTAK